MNSNGKRYIVRTHESGVTRDGRFRNIQYDNEFPSEHSARESMFHKTRGHETLYPTIRRRDLIEVSEGVERFLGFIHSRHYSWDFVFAEHRRR
jgi:hypothetical protein